MRFLIALSLISIVFLAGCTSGTVTKTPSGVKHTVEIIPAGFSPNSLKINVSDTVDFVNKMTTEHWPASDPHPTHNGYPEKGGCIGSKFDACKSLSQGESFEFTFTSTGNWCYHDHLNPSMKGCVTVQ